MSDKVEVTTGKPIVKRKGETDVKLTKNQEQVDLDKNEFQEELKSQRAELRKEQEAGESSLVAEQELPISQNFEGEVVDPEAKFTLTPTELTSIIRAAQGIEETPHLVHRMPEDLKGVDKAQYIVDDGLAEVGKGMHRMADGARDIVGGVIDILTLGRAHRK